jgi:hypothetical protein
MTKTLLWINRACPIMSRAIAGKWLGMNNLSAQQNVIEQDAAGVWTPMLRLT